MEIAKGKETHSEDLNPKDRAHLYHDHRDKTNVVAIPKIDSAIHIQSEPHISFNVKSNLHKMMESAKEIEQK
jgi:hypothetical protein